MTAADVDMTGYRTQDEIDMDDPILMEEGMWFLRAHNTCMRNKSPSRLQSYIAHTCPVVKLTYYWYSLMLIDTVCSGCQERPPNDLMGLWKLHNMEYIQNGNEY